MNFSYLLVRALHWIAFGSMFLCFAASSIDKCSLLLAPYYLALGHHTRTCRELSTSRDFRMKLPTLDASS